MPICDIHMSIYTGNDVQMLKRCEYCYASKYAMPMFLTSCETESTYKNMAERELLSVRVATLLRNKYVRILKIWQRDGCFL